MCYRRESWSRREIVSGLTLAWTAGLVGGAAWPAAAEPPPETTRIRLEWAGGACNAPKYVAEELLRSEGFMDVQYVNREAKNLTSRRLKALSSGEADFDLMFAPDIIVAIDKASPIVTLAGQHTGCFELFGTSRIRAVRDLKHKTIAVRESGATEHLLLSVILSYVGLDPQKDVTWLTVPFAEAVRLLAEEKIDAVLGFPPLPQQLRARQIGQVVLNSTTDRPWSQYFCCMVVGNREFVRRYPVATKRVVRGLMKANEVCAPRPSVGSAPGRKGRYDELRLCDPDAKGNPLRQVARLRSRGHASVLRAPPSRGRDDQIESAEGPRPGRRLALPQGTEEGVEGVRERRRGLPAALAGERDEAHNFALRRTGARAAPPGR
jgi:NitT/TauT family transport system substrate-binding protein